MKITKNQAATKIPLTPSTPQTVTSASVGCGRFRFTKAGIFTILILIFFTLPNIFAVTSAARTLSQENSQLSNSPGNSGISLTGRKLAFRPGTGNSVFLTGPSKGDPLITATNYLKTQKAVLGLTDNEIDAVLITDRYASKNNGVTHIYTVKFRQIRPLKCWMELQVSQLRIN